jgi:hypothetical protein
MIFQIDSLSPAVVFLYFKKRREILFSLTVGAITGTLLFGVNHCWFVGYVVVYL